MPLTSQLTNVLDEVRCMHEHQNIQAPFEVGWANFFWLRFEIKNNEGIYGKEKRDEHFNEVDFLLQLFFLFFVLQVQIVHLLLETAFAPLSLSQLTWLAVMIHF